MEERREGRVRRWEEGDFVRARTFVWVEWGEGKEQEKGSFQWEEEEEETPPKEGGRTIASLTGGASARKGVEKRSGKERERESYFMFSNSFEAKRKGIIMGKSLSA